MELGEIAQARLIVLAVVLVLGSLWFLAARSDRRRRTRFAALAEAFGAPLVAESEHHWHFATAAGERQFTVRCRHMGGGIGSHTQGRWYLVTETALAGVSALHSVEIRPRLGRRRVLDGRDAGFDRAFAVRDFGMPLRDGWLGARVRGAIAHFYAHEAPLDPLSVEEGRLVHRGTASLARYDAATLRELMVRQAAVAGALERAL